MREKREQKDRKDFTLILEAFQHRGIDKGARGIQMRLLHCETPVVMNLKKIRRLMAKYNLVCPIRKPNPYKQMARRRQKSTIAKNIVNRKFESFKPREAFSTDITYLFYNHGHNVCYLSMIRDTCTHESLAHVVSDSLAEDFVLETVRQLINRYGNEIKPKETILHSDQGVHYTAKSFSRLLRDKNLRQSMSRRANCWDNAPQESFFGHMKDEIKSNILEAASLKDVQRIIEDYMYYYNHERGQWSLAKLTPVEYFQYRTTNVFPNTWKRKAAKN